MLPLKVVDFYVVNNFLCQLISYNLTGKWNLDIDLFQISTYCNFPNFSSNETFY